MTAQNTRLIANDASIKRLRLALEEAGFLVDSVFRRLHLRQWSDLISKDPIQLHYYTRDHDRLNTCLRLWLLGESLDKEQVDRLLNSALVEALLSDGFLRVDLHDSNKIRSPWVLIPMGRLWIMGRPSAGDCLIEDLLEAHAKARLVPPGPAEVGIVNDPDGLLALAAAKQGARIVRCLEPAPNSNVLARWNLLLNQAADRVHFFEGTIPADLPGQPFPLLIDHQPLPLGPSGEEDSTDRLLGDEWLENWIRFAQQALAHDGMAVILTHWASSTDADPTSRLLGFAANFMGDVAFLSRHILSREDYALRWGSKQTLGMPQTERVQTISRWKDWLDYKPTFLISEGVIALRNSPRGHAVHFDNIPSEALELWTGEDIVDLFYSRDIVNQLEDDDTMLRQRPVPILDGCIEQRIDLTPAGTKPIEALFYRRLGMRINEEGLLKLVAFFCETDGSRSLKSLINLLAQNSQVDAQALTKDVLVVVRQMMRLGLITIKDASAVAPADLK